MTMWERDIARIEANQADANKLKASLKPQRKRSCPECFECPLLKRGIPVPPHVEARAVGVAEKGGLPLSANRWPPGTYGHADYWLGYYKGPPPKEPADV